MSLHKGTLPLSDAPLVRFSLKRYTLRLSLPGANSKKKLVSQGYISFATICALLSIHNYLLNIYVSKLLFCDKKKKGGPGNRPALILLNSH